MSRLPGRGLRVDPRAASAVDRLLAWAEHERARRDARAPCRYDFDPRGDLTTIVEPDGERREFVYDASRRLIEVREAGGVTRYAYDDADRLATVQGPRVERRHVYDEQGRLCELHRGHAGGVKYRYDDAGRVTEYRTAEIACMQRFDAQGRVVGVSQVIGGVELKAELVFDEAGRLAAMQLPGHRIAYRWDAAGRPLMVELDGRLLAQWEFDGRCPDGPRIERVYCAGGVIRETDADPIDGRALKRSLRRGEETLDEVVYRYDDSTRVCDDGRWHYSYDAQGRLADACRQSDGSPCHCAYDAAGNRVSPAPMENDDDRIVFDALGQPAEVRQQGRTLARFTYDAKGRLATMHADGRQERYLYGPADELLAVADAQGKPLRIYVHTPTGCLAEVAAGEVRFLHLDRRGACHLVTGMDGRVLARHDYDAFGAPLTETTAHGPAPWFGGRRWCAEAAMYRCGARWYDAIAGRFVSPDSYTAAPDDERLMHPLLAGAAQVALRDQVLPNWLRQPASRNRHAFCANDPVNRVDPNGHWSFGGVVLSLLGAIWTLPNTLFGLLIEVSCLVGEVVRWLAWLFSGGNLTWATPGFDAASSSNLNAFALVFRGGWLGSFRSLLGITFGNVFFVYHDWENLPELQGAGTVTPPAYGGTVTIPLHDALYEHELRHTNQYGWLGPFFHLGMPAFGFYEWDVIFHGYQDAVLEKDARDHGGF